jgi:hypothetical protein
VTNLYLAYGLTFQSDCRVPGLLQITSPSAPPDVQVWFEAEPSWVGQAKRLPSRILHSLPPNEEAADATLRVIVYGEEEFFGLAYSEGPEFLLDATATRLWGACPPPQVIEDLVTYLVGPVMGFILRRRGFTSLHACTFELNDAAIVLCGAGGSGKSTTAAALALRDIPVLCEDVTPLVVNEEMIVIPPGYPRICLWPEAVRLLLKSRETLPRITPTWEKRYLALGERGTSFGRHPRRLSAIYFLEARVEEPGAPRIEAMKPGDGLLCLVKNSYAKRLLSREQRAAEFDLLCRVATSVEMRRLIPSARESKLDVLCDLILDDAAALTAERHSAAASPLR